MREAKDAQGRAENASSSFAVLCQLIDGNLSGRTSSRGSPDKPFSENSSPTRLQVDSRSNRFTNAGWREVLRLAEHHGVVPLVARNVLTNVVATNNVAEQQSVAEFPREFLDALQSANDDNLRRSLWFTAELMRMLRHFGQRQLRAVPYKGPVLAQSIYGDATMRSFNDLDFLIAPADFWRAKEALAELGYLPNKEMTDAVERLWLRNGYERSFDGIAGKNLLELQWRLLPKFYAVDLTTEELMARAGRIQIGECEAACLSPEDSLVVQCLHAAKHLWTRLIWLCDIRETLKLPDLDLELAFARAKQLGIARMLGVSLWLVGNLLCENIEVRGGEESENQKSRPQGSQRNAEAFDKLLTDHAVVALGQEFAERLRSGVDYDFESTAYFRLILKLRERRSDRWRYLRRLAWIPGENDINAVKLPERLFGLYGVVRLGRLAGRVMGR